MVIVPTEVLQIQWINILKVNNLNTTVHIINSVIKKDWKTDFLILDEVHLFVAETFIEVFNRINYKMLLAMTATLDRLDGKETLLNKYCTVIDVITIDECILNKWLSPYKEYKIMLDVDLTEYNIAHRNFLDYFAFFNFDFDFAMKCVTNPRMRELVADKLSKTREEKVENLKKVSANAFGFLFNLKKRKSFVMSHPKKIEITNLIIENRLDKKIITFSPTIKMAEKIKYGLTLNSGIAKSKRKITLEDFCNLEKGVLNSNKALNTGVDVPGVNTGIILSGNSSSIVKTQTVGRIIRYSPDKEAEIFTLVIRGTMEEAWYSKSTKNNNYITIDEENLINLLKGETFNKQKNISKDNILLRF